MNRIRNSITVLCVAFAGALGGCNGLARGQALSEEELACKALADTRNLTVLSAKWVDAAESTPAYCYVKGIISPAIVSL